MKQPSILIIIFLLLLIRCQQKSKISSTDDTSHNYKKCCQYISKLSFEGIVQDIIYIGAGSSKNKIIIRVLNSNSEKLGELKGCMVIHFNNEKKLTLQVERKKIDQFSLKINDKLTKKVLSDEIQVYNNNQFKYSFRLLNWWKGFDYLKCECDCLPIE